jgi:hypothetical protein
MDADMAVGLKGGPRPIIQEVGEITVCRTPQLFLAGPDAGFITEAERRFHRLIQMGSAVSTRDYRRTDSGRTYIASLVSSRNQNRSALSS